MPRLKCYTLMDEFLLEVNLKRKETIGKKRTKPEKRSP